MAENKNSFILYSDSKEVVEALTDEQAGKLLKHIFGYVNDESPTCDDPFVNLAFIPIKQSLKRDLKKWEGKQEQRKEAGRRSAEIRKQNANEAKRKATTVNDRSVSSTVSVSGNVNGSGNVNDNVIKEIYSLYPSVCPVKKSSTGKTSSNKAKIKTMLNNISADELKSTIKRYIAECTKNKTYVKNFGTFLNNLPDYSEPEKSKEILYTYHAEGFGMQIRKTKKQLDFDTNICQGRITQLTEIKP